MKKIVTNWLAAALFSACFAIAVGMHPVQMSAQRAGAILRTTRGKLWVSYALGMLAAGLGLFGHLNGSFLALTYGLAGTWVFAMATGIYTERATGERR